MWKGAVPHQLEWSKAILHNILPHEITPTIDGPDAGHVVT